MQNFPFRCSERELDKPINLRRMVLVSIMCMRLTYLRTWSLLLLRLYNNSQGDRHTNLYSNLTFLEGSKKRKASICFLNEKSASQIKIACYISKIFPPGFLAQNLDRENSHNAMIAFLQTSTLRIVVGSKTGAET